MNLWRFLKTESNIQATKVIALAATAGLSNTLLIIIINFASQAASSGGSGSPSGRYVPSSILFLFYVATILTYVLTQRILLRIATTEVERLIGRLRTRIADKLRKADLQAVEELGKTYIFTVATRDTQTISQTASPAVIALQSAIMVLFTAAYIAFLNIFAFALILIILWVAVQMHFRQRGRMTEDLMMSTSRENEAFEILTHVLDGFKEVKLSTTRSDDLNETLAGAAKAVVEIKSRTAILVADNFVFSQTVFYILLGAIVFVLPRIMGPTYLAHISVFTDAVLFIMGPLSTLISILPLFTTAQVAVQNIMNLEAKLDELGSAARDHGEISPTPPADFREIRLVDVTFEYRNHADAPVFRIEPVNLTIRKQQILFIVGGNGSGKSTLLKLLTALYYPLNGSVKLDGENVAVIGYTRYRNMFSAVFSDYHLFDRLYGLKKSEEEVTKMLREMELDQKTQFLDGRFTSQELSTGQRKRLALVVSMLEDRPILVLDEWAADQDPVFRKRFYNEILPRLRREGKKTIIAATHDDRYFDVADVVLKMEAGALSTLRS